MKSPPLAAAVLIAALAARPAAAQTTGASAGVRADAPLETWRENVVVFHRLDWAEALIADSKLQERLRGEDERTFQTVFDESLSAVDLKQLLEKRPHGGDLRYHLVTRNGCRLCGHPQEIEQWVADNRISTDQRTLSDALWDWDALKPARIDCLRRGRWTPDSWRATTLLQRRSVLRECVPQELTDANAPFPRDRASYQKILDAAKRSVDVFFPSEFFDITARLDKADLLLKAQERAEAAARAGDPQAQSALKTAAGADSEAAAAALQAYYDHAAPRDGDAAGPAETGEPRPAGAGQYPLLAAAMGKSLLEAVRGTWAGDDLTTFYDKQPLRVEIRRLDRAWALFDPRSEAIVLDRSAVETMLTREGLSPDQAVRDPAALRRVAVAFSSVFVHEAEHHETHIWEKDRGLSFSPAADDELAAMQNEALFLIEKFRRDKDFSREFLHAARPATISGALTKLTGLGSPEKATIAQDSLSMARLFREDPEGFRWQVRNRMYAYRDGNEGVAAGDYERVRADAENYEAEIRRRAGLSVVERAALDSLPRQTALSDPSRWPRERLETVPTPTLRELDARARSQANEVQSRYALYRRRADEAAALADRRRALLARGPLPDRPGPVEPPLPDQRGAP